MPSQSSALAVQSPALQYAHELIPEGFRLGNVDVGPLQQFDIKNLRMSSFNLVGEVDDIFSEMRNQANICGGLLGLSDCQRMLDNRKDIPYEFMPYNILIPGTELVDQEGHKYVGYLKCSGNSHNNWRFCVTSAHFFKMFSGICKFACI